MVLRVALAARVVETATDLRDELAETVDSALGLAGEVLGGNEASSRSSESEDVLHLVVWFLRKKLCCRSGNGLV